MSDIRARLIDALQQEWPSSYSDTVDVLLSLPGIAIVELPAALPKGQTTWPDDAAFPVGERAAVRVFRKSIRWRDSKYPVDYARALAAALLAAAVQAQEEQP